MTGHSDAVMWLAISSDGLKLVSGSWDGTIKIWDLTLFQCVQTLTGHKSKVSVVAIHPNNKTIASGSWDNTVRLWNIDDKTPADSSQCNYFIGVGHSDAITGLAYNIAGTRLVSSSADSSIRIWEDVAGIGFMCSQTIVTETPTTSIAFHPKGDFMVTGSKDCIVRVFDAITGKCCQKLAGHTGAVVRVL
jgi:WD40 repeat protein